MYRYNLTSAELGEEEPKSKPTTPPEPEYRYTLDPTKEGTVKQLAQKYDVSIPTMNNIVSHLTPAFLYRPSDVTRGRWARVFDIKDVEPLVNRWKTKGNRPRHKHTEPPPPPPPPKDLTLKEIQGLMSLAKIPGTAHALILLFEITCFPSKGEPRYPISEVRAAIDHMKGFRR
jgi:hypothetical protein